MAYLKNRPTWFIKEGVRRAAYYTIQARELRAEGFVEEGEKAEVASIFKPAPEVVVEAGVDAYDVDSLKADKKEQVEQEAPLDAMSKSALLSWALEQGHELRSSFTKNEILEICKEIKKPSITEV